MMRIGHCVTFTVEMDGTAHRYLVEKGKTVGVVAAQIADELIAEERRPRKRNPGEIYTLLFADPLPTTTIISSAMEGQQYQMFRIEAEVDA